MTTATIGTATPLIEGGTKVTGRTRFINDLQLVGMLHGRFVLSTHAHANIRAIDTSAAVAMPGVAAVITAQDLPNIEPTSRQRLMLARDRVIFAGQPVALILAETEVQAEDAAEHVYVAYDPLPAAITLEEAMADDAPLVWPGGRPGDASEMAGHGVELGSGDDEGAKLSNIAKHNHFERGDVAAGFAEADVVLEQNFTLPMVHQSPIETHGCAIQLDSFSGEVTVWSSTQGPFVVRQHVAEILGISDSDVRCIGTPVGGGFGSKGVLYEPLLALAARIVKRPIRLILTRYEEMVATIPVASGRARVKLGAKEDGTFTALEVDVIFNSGVYPSAPIANAMVVPGSIYSIDNVRVDGRDVLCFKPSSGAYRAPGVPQGLYALESVVDDMATALGLDPIDLRLKNAAKPGDPMIHGETWPKMGMTEVLQALQAHPVWQNRDEARSAGRGVGIAVGGWPGGTGPATAACMLDRDGILQVQVGAADISGVNTTFMMLAAETFGIPPEKIRVVNGDTNTGIFGLNAGGSKITYTVGPAVVQAATEARRQTLEIAAELMEAAVEDLELVDGKVHVRGVPDRVIELSEIAPQTLKFGGLYSPIFGQGRNVVVDRSPGFCAQLAEVEVDRATGVVTVHKLVVVQDVGKALNPLLVEGQMMGGAIQGVGWALYENMVYDDGGQPISASWMDYTVPRIDQGALSIDTVLVEVPSDHGPLGAKGVGEPPVTATAGAINNAITDAIGVRLTDMPMTPPRVLAALSKRS